MRYKKNKETLVLKDFRVSIKDQWIVDGVTLEIKPGEIHALMGPNGTGKSSLSMALMGHPFYQEAEGEARIGNIDLLDLSPDERARAGLFLAMQYPVAIPGAPVSDFLRTAKNALTGKKTQRSAFNRELEKEMKDLGLDPSFSVRYLNEGFSGGEKKRSEIVQARILKPKFAILDEIDSGLDIDALKSVAKGVEDLRAQGTGILIITHYRRILDYLAPDFVHVMSKGRIVRSGLGMKLAEELEASGYKAMVNEEEAAMS